jgi:hypothetical protein
MAQMGVRYWASQSTRLALLRLLSSTVGLGPDKLLVHVFLGVRRVEFLDKAQSGLKAPIQDEPGLSVSCFVVKAEKKY